MQAQIKTMRDDFAKLKEELAMVVQCLSPMGEIDIADSDNLHENWLLLLAFFKIIVALLTDHNIDIEGYSFISWT